MAIRDVASGSHSSPGHSYWHGSSEAIRPMNHSTTAQLIAPGRAVRPGAAPSAQRATQGAPTAAARVRDAAGFLCIGVTARDRSPRRPSRRPTSLRRCFAPRRGSPTDKSRHCTGGTKNALMAGSREDVVQKHRHHKANHQAAGASKLMAATVGLRDNLIRYDIQHSPGSKS